MKTRASEWTPFTFDRMLTKTDLLNNDKYPAMDDISLDLYKEFSEDVLLPRVFEYTFTDDTTATVEFSDFGIYHMLGIQHIDWNIPNNKLFSKIEQGLSFADFSVNSSIKARFKNNKPRIRMFACVYQTLRLGRFFYCPNGEVLNTKDVKMDYIIYRNIGGKGNNVGIRKEGDRFLALTLLVSKAKDPEKYIDKDNLKEVKSLVISDKVSGEEIEHFIYTEDFITQLKP